MRRISAKTVLPRHGMVRQPAFQEQTAACRVRHRKREALVRLTAMAALCVALLGGFRLYGRICRHFDVHLSVQAVLQDPELPNGCEATSLATLLQYKGFAANKLDLAYAYIPREDFTESSDGRLGPSPEHAYAGDPATGRGFYCFAAPLAQGANRYLQEQGSSLQAVDITGVTVEGLKQYLHAGEPVAVWVTLDLSAPRTGSFSWTLRETGEEYIPYVNLHCVVLTGWGRGVCEIMDPLRGCRTVDQQAFIDCFVQMGSRALVIH